MSHPTKRKAKRLSLRAYPTMLFDGMMFLINLNGMRGV